MNQRFAIELRGSGAYVPAEILDNRHFCRYLDTSDDWIVTRTGIRQRRRVSADESTSVLAANAAQRALDDAGLKATDLDAIICATATGDYPFPSTASLVQNLLQARHVACFDVGAACAGFLHAAVVGTSLIHTGAFRNVLVIGAETLTRCVDRDDRSTVVLFGDGAGAVVLGVAQDGSSGVLHWELGCDGSHSKDIWIPAGGSKLPASANTVAEKLHFMKMRGREVYKFAVVKMQELIDRALSATGLQASDLKLVIPHQSNLRIIESVREKMNLPHEKIAVNIDRFGNTSAASVPMALDEARRSGKLQRGDYILLLALGAGLTWAAMVIRL